MTISNRSYCFSGIVTLYFFFFLAFLIPHTFASPCGHDQRDALLEFKHECLVNKSYSTPLLSSWNKSSDCCSWEGVTCHDKSGKVISLDLKFTPLNNSLKPNSGLFKLQHLSSLTLQNCGLYGEIPSSLRNLSRLTNLDLSYNGLVGELPAASVGNLSSLTRLDLWRNDLVGEVLVSIRNLTLLEYISLGYNKFGGYTPASFANFIKLSTFDISHNQFTGKFPFPLLNLTTSLSILGIGNNQFKSTFPSDMSGFHNLEYLDVSGNSFSGPFPTSLFTIPSLSSVNLEGNRFKGPIEFKNISSLSSQLGTLYLAQNKFDGPIPKSISSFHNLHILDVSHNSLSGPVPTPIFSNSDNLKRLYLSNNKLEGEIPSWFGGVLMLLVSDNSFTSFGKSLDLFDLDLLTQTLDFSSNSFQGPLPHWICNVNPLTRLNLDLSNNNFSGSIPRCLGNTIIGFKGLNLQNNNLSGVLPDVFVDATELVSLDVSNNQLEGKLPGSLINCISLLILNVQNNKIKDTYPSWLGPLVLLNVLILGSNDFYGPLYHPHVSVGFQSLKIIDISRNNFNGTLPPFYFANWPEMTMLTEYGEGYMEDGYPYHISMEMVNKGVYMLFELIRTDFRAIDFSGNKFSGEIPTFVGLLKGLRLLNLSGNAFTSDIPQSLANLISLEALDLSRNQLSGQIPVNLGSLSFLSVINFSHNDLQGPIPRGTQFQRQNCSAFIGNPKLFGLEDICGETHHVPSLAPPQQEAEDLSEPKEQVISWKAAMIAYVPAVFFGLVIGHIFSPFIHKWVK